MSNPQEQESQRADRRGSIPEIPPLPENASMGNPIEDREVGGSETQEGGSPCDGLYDFTLLSGVPASLREMKVSHLNQMSDLTRITATDGFSRVLADVLSDLLLINGESVSSEFCYNKLLDGDAERCLEHLRYASGPPEETKKLSIVLQYNSQKREKKQKEYSFMLPEEGFPFKPYSFQCKDYDEVEEHRIQQIKIGRHTYQWELKTAKTQARVLKTIPQKDRVKNVQLISLMAHNVIRLHPKTGEPFLPISKSMMENWSVRDFHRFKEAISSMEGEVDDNVLLDLPEDHEDYVLPIETTHKKKVGLLNTEAFLMHAPSIQV